MWIKTDISVTLVAQHAKKYVFNAILKVILTRQENARNFQIIVFQQTAMENVQNVLHHII